MATNLELIRSLPVKAIVEQMNRAGGIRTHGLHVPNVAL